MYFGKCSQNGKKKQVLKISVSMFNNTHNKILTFK